ncbi:MAG: tetratricopeptide repeat protein [Planctomycetota bacterium]|nr:tetratricopeptide repeat protein [Planctomycetota bacterium]
MIPEKILEDAAELVRQGDQASAVEALEEGLNAFPDDQNILNNLGCLLLEDDQFDRALDLLSRAYEIDENNVDVASNYGYALIHMGEVTIARGVYERILADKPDHIESINHLALIAAFSGNFQEALEYYEKALSLAPQDVRILNNYGSTLRKTGRFSEALRVLKKAHKLAPQDVEVLGNLASAYIRLRDYMVAERYLEIAIEISPDDALSHYQLGTRFREEFVEKRADRSADKEYLRYLVHRARSSFNKYLELTRDYYYEDYVNYWLEELDKGMKDLR